MVAHRHRRQSGLDALEDAQPRRGVRRELAAVRQPRHRLGDGRVHAPGAGEEVAELGRNDIRSVHHPAERGRVHRLGVGALAHLRQLLRIAQEEQARCGERHGDRGGERELPGLVDHQQVEAATGNPALVAEVPCRSADDEPAGLLGDVRGHAVLGDDGEGCRGRGILRRLRHLRGRDAGVDDAVEHVLDHGVRLGDHADLVAVLADQARDDVRADVGLAGAWWALHREVAAVEVEERPHDRIDVVP